MFDIKPPMRLDDVPAYQQALYLRHLEHLANRGCTENNARAHAQAAAWRAADEARARIEAVWSDKDRLEHHPKKS